MGLALALVIVGRACHDPSVQFKVECRLGIIHQTEPHFVQPLPNIPILRIPIGIQETVPDPIFGFHFIVRKSTFQWREKPFSLGGWSVRQQRLPLVHSLLRSTVIRFCGKIGQAFYRYELSSFDLGFANVPTDPVEIMRQSVVRLRGLRAFRTGIKMNEPLPVGAKSPLFGVHRNRAASFHRPSGLGGLNSSIPNSNQCQSADENQRSSKSDVGAIPRGTWLQTREAIRG
jgi:hypothetical protein